MKARGQRTAPPDSCQEFAVYGSTWTRLADDLFLWTDSCNVYLLRNGAHAVVIDAGTGAWAHHIDELGVRQIDGIVLTHTDRDQCCAMRRDTVPPAVASARLGAARRRSAGANRRVCAWPQS